MKGIKWLFLILSLVMAVSGCTPVSSAAVQEEPVPADEVLATPSPTPSPTPVPAPKQYLVEDPLPCTDPADKYFNEEDAEDIRVNDEAGYWLYRSFGVFIQVERVFNEEEIQTYFVADIRLKEGEREIAGYANPEHPGQSRAHLYDIARIYQAVIAINGDYMDRVQEDRKGIIIRDGIVYNEKKAEDTLAFFPDGTMRIFSPGEVTAQDLLDQGVNNTFSFGPTLVRDGELNEDVDHHSLSRRNPRCALGMVEPNHFILVVVDGRHSSYSKGMTLRELADVFLEYDCQLAYNLDGGASATMTFMGENISQYNGSKTGQRKVPDALLFGVSEQVPQ